MPNRAARKCPHVGCNQLLRGPTWQCSKHPRIAWRKRDDAPKRITGRHLQRARAELFANEPLCAECIKHGRIRLATQRDHVLSLEENGEDIASNTQGLCDECHAAKTKRESARGRTRGGGSNAGRAPR